MALACMQSSLAENDGKFLARGHIKVSSADLVAASEVEFAFRFDGKGAAEPIEVNAAADAIFPLQPPAAKRTGPSTFAWIHCKIGAPVLADLRARHKIDELIFDRLSEAETRPLCIPHKDGLLLNLRGRAVDEVASESDLVALRLWISRHGVISAWRRETRAMQEVLGEIARGYCARSVGDLVSRIALRLADSIEPMVDDLTGTIDDLEVAVVNGSQKVMRRELSEVRREAIDLRRFIYPQRDALSTFLIEHVDFIREAERVKLHEAHDHMTRFIEELEVTRERCSVLHDEIIDGRSERMNRQILLLSVVSAIFLPASLIAGLLGMNVAGIPAADHPFAFPAVCIAMVALIAIELVLFRWLKII
jgi:zinc transporter